MFDWLSNMLGNAPAGNNGANTFASGYGVGNLPAEPSNVQAPVSMLGAGTSIPGTAGAGAASPFGFNLGTGQLAFGGLKALGDIWNAFKTGQMASKTFDFTKSLANTNLSNQTQAYNTNLEGQTQARYAQENQSPAAALDFINAHKLASKTL